MVRVDADQPNTDVLPFEMVEGGFEAVHRADVGDVDVTEIEMDRVRWYQRRPSLEQPVDRGRGQQSGGTDQTKRSIGIVDHFHPQGACDRLAPIDGFVRAVESDRSSSDDPATEAGIGLQHVDHSE